MRENGSLRQVLTDGIPGEHQNPCWERTAKEIAFTVRRAGGDQPYTANYPHTADLDERMDNPHPRWGINLKEYRGSLQRRGSLIPGSTALSWTPNGLYLTAVIGSRARLIPTGPYSFPTAPLDLPAPAASGGLGWRNDGRSFLYTTAGATSVLRSQTLMAPNLDVLNLKDFMDFLEWQGTDLTRLAHNRFFAGGRLDKQMYDIYENTDYSNLPVFITTDAALHLHHLIFDYAYRTVETERLMPAALALVTHYLDASLKLQV